MTSGPPKWYGCIMVDISDDQIISLVLVACLLIISKARDMLDNGGIVAATTVGLTVSLAGHWTWLVILMSFLALGSSATKWKFEEKMAISLAEANEGLRGWRNVLANGTAPMAVPQGTNGGMSPTGTLAAVAGALSIALVSAFLASQQEYEISLLTLILVVSTIGWLGCQIDSLLGALLENDGYVGKHTVNLLATSSGAVLAVLFTNQFL